MGSIAMEEYELMKDSKYRVYVSAVDKALKNFDYTSEWADLISALGKLNKVLLNYMKFPVIPRRIKISKRLAQCMHPALPSGVHLKALETYDIIFKCMGTNRLSHELFIYSAGLFPLLGHAAMNVRPSLLTVYETHFVPLGERLRPGLSGFLSGVLPGLEEGSDHFERTTSLLEQVCDGVGPRHFYGCLWDCLASNSGIRLPAVSYVLSHFNKKLSMEDQLYIIGPDVDVMINALCAGVQDSSVLVQRSSLDLLLVGLPMHNSQLVKGDKILLVTAALTTILRRDMSLNRRLFAWLLGSEVNLSHLCSEHPLIKHLKNADSSKSYSSPYFDLYSKDILIQAIKNTLNQGNSHGSNDVKPYRLLVSLLDKPDIGPVILDDILYEVFRALFLACEGNKDVSTKSSASGAYKGSHELLKSANLLFSTLEPCYVWLYTATLFDDACKMKTNSKSDENHDSSAKVKSVGSGPPNLLEVCILSEFLLDTVSIDTYLDAPSEHLPGLFLRIISLMTEHCDVLSPEDITMSLHLCSKILSRVQPVTQCNTENNNKSSVESQVVLNSVEQNDSIKTLKTENSTKSTRPKVLNNKSFTKPKKSKFRLKQSSASKSSVAQNDNNTVLLSVKQTDSSIKYFSSEMSPDVSTQEEFDQISFSSSGRVSPNPGSMSTLQLGESDLTSETISDNGDIIADSVPTGRQSAIEDCIKQYELFYVKFISSRCAINCNINELFERLLIKQTLETEGERTEKLERLLYSCLKSGSEKTSQSTDSSLISALTIVPYENNDLNQVSFCNWEESMKVASSLLVELSTFPNYFLPEQLAKSDELKDVSAFPEWLKVLIVCACWLTKSPVIQLTAISTILDLISLVQTQCNRKEAAEGVFSVVMIPLLKPWHIHYTEQHTNVVQVLAKVLWHHLGHLPTNQKVMCVELLHQLHNILPLNDAVENVIGESLTEENSEKKMDAFQRFSLLWHIGREVETKLGPNKNLRTFDKSLLKMLDNLHETEVCPLKIQAQTWLIHSLHRGDIPRLLDPLLYILLDPVTARMSVLHVSIEHSNTVLTCSNSEKKENGETDESAAKIYAISSVDGNVIYHVSDSTLEKRKNSKHVKSRTISTNPIRAKRIFAVTTLLPGYSRKKHYITEKKSYLDDLDLPPTKILSPKQNISVFVNPFVANNSTTTSNDSATEDDFIITKPYKQSELIKSATRISNVRKDDRRPTSLEISSFTSNRKTKSAEYLKVSPNDEISKLKQRKSLQGEFETGDDGDSSDSNTPTDFELSNGIMRRWSVGEDLLGEAELSTPAFEYFDDCNTSLSIVEDIIHDVLDMVFDRCTSGKFGNEKRHQLNSFHNQPSLSVDVHQLHSHMLLYCGVYDSNRTLYALHTLRSILLTNGHMFLCAAATTGIANVARGSGLLMLLARHRKSVFGRNFHGDITVTGNEFGSAYRSSMYLEVLISVCLYFARSYYPNLGQMRLTQEEIAGNRQVQLASTELLMLMCSELILIVRENGKGFACYIGDLLSRCKVQKVVLHCVLSSVYNMINVGSLVENQNLKVKESYIQRTFTEEIVHFNDPATDPSETRCKYRSSDHSEGFQIQLLRLLLALIMLEYYVNNQKGDIEGSQVAKGKEVITPLKTNQYQLKYSAERIIPQQPMFLAAVLSALEQDHLRHLHQHWTTLITSALPFMGGALSDIVITVINQLCNNIERLSLYYEEKHNSSASDCCQPSDYTVTQLEALTVLCHYCLLDSSQQLSHVAAQNGGLSTFHVGFPGADPGQILNNLVHVFTPTPLQMEGANIKEKSNSIDPLLSARVVILSNMPRIIASVAALWQAVMTGNDWEHRNCVLGNPRVVKHQLLEFLSPISLHHGTNFLAAIAVAWQDRKCDLTGKKVLPVASPNQQVLVYLVGSIRVLPIDTFVQTVHQVVKQPPPIQGAKQDLSLEVSMLELFYCYLQTCSGPQLVESWGSLLGLLKDGLSLTPPAQFLMLAVLNEFVQKCPAFAEKKEQRDLQDITAKFVESCGQIAGACLEQTTWLRRNLAVREEEPALSSNSKERDSSGIMNVSAVQYSVQAQSVLAELLAPLLDVVYGSQEKERVVTLLTALMYNITPYLKNHTRRNVPSFHACSQLLASLSSYQYTRKAWRRDVFDLLLDPALFQMEENCLQYWRTVIDNLMTHDNTTFRDLMSRVSLAQSGSLSIFTSRDQEYESRAQLLKRLAFVILCSETDQYHKYMPEIQERLADSLRLPQVIPSIQAQVFLCFRVLLLRMSPQHITSLWPTIISELVQVFLHIEQELSTDSEEFRRNNSSHIRLLSALDSSWVVNSNNGLHAHGHPHWLQLQLAAAKLLDTALVMPAHRLPQFQMYRWAFVGNSESVCVSDSQSEDIPRTQDFIPHITRIANLMDMKYQVRPDPIVRPPGQLLLTQNSIRTLKELHPFFSTLSLFPMTCVPPDKPCSISQIEASIEFDFLEKLSVR